MIKEQEVLELFEKYMKTHNKEDEHKFNISVIKYFIQEFKFILENFKDEGHEKRITDLHNFYFNFEKNLSSDDPEPENYLESEIENLFLKVTGYLSRKEAEILIKDAKSLLKEFNK